MTKHKTRAVSQITKGCPLSNTTNYLPLNISNQNYPSSCTPSDRK